MRPSNFNFLPNMLSLGSKKLKFLKHSSTNGLLAVRNIFMPNFITQKSSELTTDLEYSLTSHPYNKIGIHLTLISCNIRSSLARPINLLIIALQDLLKALLRREVEHTNLTPAVITTPKYLNSDTCSTTPPESVYI